jgi:hypothetical protein
LPNLAGIHRIRQITGEIFRDLSNSRCDRSNEPKFLFLKIVIEAFLKNDIRYPASPPKFFAPPKNLQFPKFAFGIADKIGAGILPHGKL